MNRQFVKTVKGLGAGLSYLSGAITGKPFIIGMPPAISFELTNHCNLKCPECYSGSGRMTRNKGFMDPSLFSRIISELEPYLVFMNLYFQGEPMMHPEFFKFTGYSGKIRTVVSTNGHFLSAENAGEIARSGIEKLIVSLDGMDAPTYSLYRKNGDFEKVMHGIMHVSEAIKLARSRVKLEIQFLINRFNEQQVSLARDFARRVNATLRLKSMQVISVSDAEAWMPADDLFRRYESSGNGSVIKSNLPDRCLRIYLNPVVTWDGKVLPCCFDKDAEHVMGDLNRDSFRAIWKGEKYKAFRKEILTRRKSIAMCRNCTSGLKGVVY